jgi:exportin-5
VQSSRYTRGRHSTGDEPALKPSNPILTDATQAAVEVLYAISCRPHLQDDEAFVQIICPMFTPGTVSLLREVYRWTLADLDVHDINEQKYSLCKKLAEVSYLHRSGRPRC